MVEPTSPTCAAWRLGSRATIAASIIRSRDVADRYRTVVIQSTAGAVMQGMVVYLDGIILQTAADKTVPFPRRDRRSGYAASRSCPPAARSIDEPISPTYAYLKSLQ